MPGLSGAGLLRRPPDRVRGDTVGRVDASGREAPPARERNVSSSASWPEPWSRCPLTEVERLASVSPSHTYEHIRHPLCGADGVRRACLFSILHTARGSPLRRGERFIHLQEGQCARSPS